MSEHRPLENKVALITGASRGIGKGRALSFAEAGADLLPTVRSMDDLERTARLRLANYLGRGDYTAPEQAASRASRNLASSG